MKEITTVCSRDCYDACFMKAQLSEEGIILSIKGDPENPLTWEELIAKFENLTEPVFHPEKRKRIINSVRNLDRSETLDSLMSLLEKR